MNKLTGGTLSIDVGGSGIKGMVLDPEGRPINDRVRIRTPRPASASAVLDTIEKVAARQPVYERVSVGFPGVVRFGAVMTVPNLELGHHPFIAGYTYEELVGKAALKADGYRQWSQHVTIAIEQILHTWNPHQLLHSAR
jgi:predicted NBD/HSP70 family sugar kinase